MKAITRKPIVFMFSGQGSHYYEMGQELFEKDPLFAYWMQAADAIYKNLTDLSIIKTLYDDNHKKSEPFTRTLLTHPAIFMVQHALGQLLLAQGIQPDYALGTSLGEFAAAVFAGILSFEDALIAVIKQAQILEEHCLPGAMLAILASPDLYESTAFLQKNSGLAAINFPSHFIVSGQPHNLYEIENYLNTQNISSQRLAVSHGFHSPLIDAGASYYQRFIEQYSFSTPILPFISCASVGSLLNLLPSHFWDSIRLPIQFQITLRKLEKNNSYYYVDVGPSGTLATFVKYNLSHDSSSQPLALLTPFSENITQTIAHLKCNF